MSLDKQKKKLDKKKVLTSLISKWRIMVLGWLETNDLGPGYLLERISKMLASVSKFRRVLEDSPNGRIGAEDQISWRWQDILQERWYWNRGIKIKRKINSLRLGMSILTRQLQDLVIYWNFLSIQKEFASILKQISLRLKTVLNMLSIF